MKPAFGTKRQLVLFLALLAVFATLFIRWRSAPSESPVTATPPAGAPRPDGEGGDRPATASRPRPSTGQKQATAEDVPIIRKEDFDPPRPHAVDGSSHNPFAVYQPPTPIPPPTPTPTWGPVQNPITVLQLPTPPPPTPTPLPPAINFKFIGTFGPKENPFAVFILNDQLINARKGDVIYEQFRVLRVGYESVDIGFVGRRDDEMRRLAIAP
jgi:hypothetical protein